jgi:MoaA/NifB/PqqE/SkfB family radical SAM enzyme
MSLVKINTLKSLFAFLFLQNIRPTYLIFFSTNKCEARCGHCFFWKETNQNISELSIVEITELAKKMGPMVQITITGGSPELRSDLYDILCVFIKFCTPLNITLCSNGNYPDILYSTVKKVLSDFNDLHLTIDISLDALNEEHDSIRGINGLFVNVVRSYSLLNQLRREYSNLRLGCGLVVSGFNNCSAIETAEWAIENLPIDNFTPVLVRGETREKLASNVDPEVFKKISNRVENLLRNGRLKGYSTFRKVINSKDFVQKQIIYRLFKERKSIIRCSAMHETVVIYPDGRVGCCELRSESLGNLRDFEMDLTNIWKSPIIKKLRKSIKTENCYCWHQCFLSASVIKSPKMWLNFVKHVLR